MSVNSQVANNSSAFTTLTIGSSSLSRSNASYSSTASSATWLWTGSPVASTTVTVASAPFAPFSASGTTQTITIS